MKKVFISVIFFIVTICSISYSMSLSLMDCIEFARKNSPSAKKAKYDYDSRKYSFEAFSADYYPQLQFSGTAPGLIKAISPITQGDGTKINQSLFQYSSSANLYLQQRIPFSGSVFSVSSSLVRNDNYIDAKHDYSWLSAPITISLSQPLFKFNPMPWDREIEGMRNSNNDKLYVEDIEYMSMDITQKFFDLFIAEMDVKNQLKNVEVNDTLYNISKGRYQVGKVAENDVLQSELTLLNVKNELDRDKLRYLRAIEDLKLAIGLQTNEDIILVPPDSIPELNIDLVQAIEHAKRNRSDFTNYKIKELESQRKLNQAQSDNGFTATLNAGYGLNQSAATIDKAFLNPFDQESLSIGINIPVFQWGKGSALIESALTEKKSSETQIERDKINFEIDVKYQVLEFNQLQKLVKLQSKALDIAERRFEVTKNRFLIGKIEFTEFNNSLAAKNEAHRSYMQTLRDYWTAYYRMRLLSHYDFERDKIISYNLK